MRRKVDLALFFVVFLAFHIGMTVRAWWDFTHPQAWDCAGNDPHVYSWAVAASGALFLYVSARIVQTEWRLWRKARTAELLKRAKELIRENRLEEAEECLLVCKALTGYGSH